MAESQSPDSMPPRRNWDAVSALIAALIGLLALCVSGYTAYIQRQQVRAQVWPFVLAGNNDNQNSVELYNKGVGPAIVRTAQIWVDGKPQPDWKHVLAALGVNEGHFSFSQQSINPNVMSPGETVSAIKFPDKDVYQRFRTAAIKQHMTIAVCYCSTLGECWRYWDNHLVGYKEGAVQNRSIGQCPRFAPADVFNN